jgi:hypothetical protein
MRGARPPRLLPGRAHRLELLLRVNRMEDGQKEVSFDPYSWIRFRKLTTIHILVFGPSDIPFDAAHAVPKPMTLENIKEVEEAFVAAVRRCKIIGCKSYSKVSPQPILIAFQVDHIELHMAHGYLIHR